MEKIYTFKTADYGLRNNTSLKIDNLKKLFIMEQNN